MSVQINTTTANSCSDGISLDNNVGAQESRSVGKSGNGVVSDVRHSSTRSLSSTHNTCRIVDAGENITSSLKLAGKIKVDMQDKLKAVHASSNLDDNSMVTDSLSKNVNGQFCKEVSNLKNIVLSLHAMIDQADDSKKEDIYNALSTINSFVLRFQNDGLGGFKKSSGEKLFDIISKPAIELQKVYNDDIELLRSTDLTEDARKAIQDRVANYQERKIAHSGELKGVCDKVASNLAKMETLAKDESGSNIEKIFNCLQKNSLSGWIVNDILGPVNRVDKNLSTALIESGNNETLQNISKLNNATRVTPMFKEVRVASLASDATVAKSKSVSTLLNSFSTTKVGIRGRSGEEPKPIVEKQNILLKINPEVGVDKGLTNSVKPKPTCSRDSVPARLMNDLHSAIKSGSDEDKMAARFVFESLKKDGLVVGENDNYKSTLSFGGMIDEKGLPTYCSVSGTTTEVLACLYYKDQATKTSLDNAFNDIIAISENPESVTALSDDFKKSFASIALFMESGEFHTSAEVLGGIYATAVALRNPDISQDKMKAGFENILTKYSSNSDLFW